MLRNILCAALVLLSGCSSKKTPEHTMPMPSSETAQLTGFGAWFFQSEEGQPAFFALHWLVVTPERAFLRVDYDFKVEPSYAQVMGHGREVHYCAGTAEPTASGKVGVLRSPDPKDCIEVLSDSSCPGYFLEGTATYAGRCATPVVCQAKGSMGDRYSVLTRDPAAFAGWALSVNPALPATRRLFVVAIPDSGRALVECFLARKKPSSKPSRNNYIPREEYELCEGGQSVWRAETRSVQRFGRYCLELTPVSPDAPTVYLSPVPNAEDGIVLLSTSIERESYLGAVYKMSEGEQGRKFANDIAAIDGKEMSDKALKSTVKLVRVLENQKLDSFFAPLIEAERAAAR